MLKRKTNRKIQYTSKKTFMQVIHPETKNTSEVITKAQINWSYRMSSLSHTSHHMSKFVFLYLLKQPSEKTLSSVKIVTKKKFHCNLQIKFSFEMYLLTLDSKFIKIADLVACLARLSCAWSTADRNQKDKWKTTNLILCLFGNRDERNGMKGNRIEIPNFYSSVERRNGKEGNFLWGPPKKNFCSKLAWNEEENGRNDVSFHFFCFNF